MCSKLYISEQFDGDNGLNEISRCSCCEHRLKQEKWSIKMSLLQSDEVLKYLSNIIHKDTQQHELHIDLTVSEIHVLTGSGSLDFGGSEFKAAQSVPVSAEKKNPEDKYRWWQLKKGTYRAFFNEAIDEGQNYTAIISPHFHAQEAGLISNTYLIPSGEAIGTLSLNFRVPETGCNIKENARLATLFLIKR